MLQIKKCKNPGCNRKISPEFIGKSFFCSTACDEKFKKVNGHITYLHKHDFFVEEFGLGTVCKERLKDPEFDRMLCMNSRETYDPESNLSRKEFKKKKSRENAKPKRKSLLGKFPEDI